MSILKDILTGSEADLRKLMDGSSDMFPDVQALRGLTQNHHHLEDVFEHTMRVFGMVDPDPTLRLAALFHDTGKFPTRVPKGDGTSTFHGHEIESTELVDDFMCEGSCFSYDECDEVCWLVENHMKLGQFPLGTSRKKQAEILRHPLAMKLIDLYIADCLGRDPQAKDRLNATLDIICDFYESERTLDQLGISHPNPKKMVVMQNILTKRPNTTKEELLAAVGE